MQYPLTLRVRQRTAQTEVERHFAVHHAQRRRDSAYVGQQEQRLYLPVSIEPTLRHQYTLRSDGRLGKDCALRRHSRASGGELRYSEFGLHTLAAPCPILPIAELQAVARLEGRPGALHSTAEAAFGLQRDTQTPLQRCQIAE